MKIRIPANELNAVLKDATRAVEAKPAVPWMSGVLLGARGGEMRAVCTNGTQTITRYAPCEVLEEGEILLDGKLLLNVASKMAACTCEIDASSGKKAVIKAGGSKTNMALMEASAFVIPAELSENDGGIFRFEIKASEFQNVMKTVLYAVPAQDTRATLTGINIQNKGDTLHVAGMDGFRIAVAKARASAGELDGSSFNIIIPKKTILDMLGMPAPGDSDISLRCDGKHICAAIGNATIHSQLIAGEYVQYQQVLSRTTCSCRAMFHVQQLKSAVERAMVMCEGKNNLLRVAVNESGITLSAIGDAGDATETLECAVSGEEMEIGFNGRLLLDAVSAIPDDEAVFKFSSSVGPALITAPEQSWWMHVVLPVRTN